MPSIFDFFSPAMDFPMFTVLLYVGTQVVQQQQITCPDEAAQMQFQSLMQQVAEQKGRQPMTVEMRRPAPNPSGYYYIRFSNYDDEGVFDT